MMIRSRTQGLPKLHLHILCSVLIGCVVKLPIIGGKSSYCSHGMNWISINTNCYKLFPDKMDFTAAKDKCKSNHAIIAMPKTNDINKKLHSMSTAHTSWIGVVGVTRNWEWLDKSSPTPIAKGFQNWAGNCYYGVPADYGGSKSITKTGRTCQKWSNDLPHKPTNGIQRHQHNLCRKADHTNTIWCYTLDKNKRWEKCFDGKCTDLTSDQGDCNVIGAKAEWYTKLCTEEFSVLCQRPNPECSDGVCYSLSRDKKTHDEAAKACASLFGVGGTMAEPRTAEEMTSVRKSIESNGNTEDVWIGGTDEDSEGAWVWKSDKEHITGNYWGHGQPSNTNDEDCMTMKPGGAQYPWNDVSCQIPHLYICQGPSDEIYPASTTTTTSTTTAYQSTTVTVDDSDDDTYELLVIVGAVAGSLVLLACIFCGYLWYRRRRRERQHLPEQPKMQGMFGPSDSRTEPSPQQTKMQKLFGLKRKNPAVHGAKEPPAQQTKMQKLLGVNRNSPEGPTDSRPGQGGEPSPQQTRMQKVFGFNRKNPESGPVDSATGQGGGFFSHAGPKSVSPSSKGTEVHTNQLQVEPQGNRPRRSSSLSARGASTMKRLSTSIKTGMAAVKEALNKEDNSSVSVGTSVDSSADSQGRSQEERSQEGRSQEERSQEGSRKGAKKKQKRGNSGTKNSTKSWRR